MRLFAFITLSCVLLLSACGDTENTPGPVAAPPEVGVITLNNEELKIITRYPGRTAALSKIEVVSSETGEITVNNVAEGQNVKQGDILIELEQEPFETEVRRLQSALDKAESTQKLAISKYKMTLPLVKKQIISAFDAQQIKSERDLAAADVETAMALLDQAKIKLRKSKVVAPIDGVVGLALTKVGDFVGPNTGPVVEIVVNDKIHVYVQVSEKDHFAYQAQVKKKKETDDPVVPSILQIELPDGSIYDQTGLVDYVGFEVSPTSNTITYRVVFPNSEGLLLGGQNITVLDSPVNSTSAIAIPQKTVQEDQSGRYVFIVDDKNIVIKKYITVGDRYNEKWIVQKGLKEGDRVIVSGLLRAKAGQAVTPAPVKSKIEKSEQE
ncbi:MAG: efflux RND transporter periplasmic adaptor subunit [Deltaproteobacteria bacterium]|nr:efflux RND transporter periplasmic adaptor subunit [Deltaproteobacteria bacterium]